MRPRRILIDALSLGQGGGGRSYLLNVLRELGRDSRGFEFTVLGDPRQLPETQAGGVGVAPVRLPEVAAGGRVPLRVAYEESVLPIRAGRFDLLYCPADLAPALAWTPTVVALRNLHIYDRSYYDTFRLRVLGQLVRAGVRRARRLVFPTRAAAEWISPRIPASAGRVAVVPHGVSGEAFDAGPPEPAHGADRTPYLFLPASVERHKRIEVLIRCLVHAADPALQVWVAGDVEVDAPYTAELRDLARSLGLAERVRFLGSVPYRRILGYYRGAVALAFTSLLETFGHPTLEAMLAGTPILAADVASLREVAGDVALYFTPDDPIGLARAADRLRRDPDATRARVAQGLARAAEFSWKRSVDGLCQVFDDVLGEGGRPPQRARTPR